MTRTRSSKPSASTTGTVPTASKYLLQAKDGPSAKLFIFPKKASRDARIVTLPHPRHATPSRYLFCPLTGLYEFTKITAPNTMPRSWLIESHYAVDEKETKATGTSQVTTSADLFLASAIDPVFLVLPALINPRSSRSAEDQKALFLSSDDYFDRLPTDGSHLSELLRCKNMRTELENRLGAVCDTVDAGDELMFRLNQEKLAKTIWAKARKLAEVGGLPSSMEEKFVTKALEAPLLVQRRDFKQSEVAAIGNGTDSEVSPPQIEAAESQASSSVEDSMSSVDSQISTAATSIVDEQSTDLSIASAIQAAPAVVALQRVRIAFDFICSSYLPSKLVDQLKESVDARTAAGLDFSPLDAYLKQLGALREDALASRSIGDYSRKRARDEEEDEARAEKRRRLEEEKKKKASESRGVRDLKKVNTAGMKKLSDFFKKK